MKSSKSVSVYKVKAKHSEVDESLFGPSKKDQSLREKQKEKMLHVTAKVTNQPEESKEDNLTIPQTEIQRMKNQAVLMTKEEVEN